MSKLRYSRQRELIYDTLKGSKRHPTAEMIYQMLKPENPSLSLGTVYRNLNLLAEEGIILRMPFAVDRYDANTEEHPHFLCKACGNLYDLEMFVGARLDSLVNDLGYQVDRHDLIFRGICKDCVANCQRNQDSQSQQEHDQKPLI